MPNPRIRIIWHEAVPETGSYDVSFAGGRPSRFFYDVAARRRGHCQNFHSFSGGMTEVVCSDEDCVSVGATQSPAHSFVPRTVPTSLQPVGALGLT